MPWKLQALPLPCWRRVAEPNELWSVCAPEQYCTLRVSDRVTTETSPYPFLAVWCLHWYEELNKETHRMRTEIFGACYHFSYCNSCTLFSSFTSSPCYNLAHLFSQLQISNCKINKTTSKKKKLYLSALTSYLLRTNTHFQYNQLILMFHKHFL